jgi:hypothetical protein
MNKFIQEYTESKFIALKYVYLGLIFKQQCNDVITRWTGYDELVL